MVTSVVIKNAMLSIEFGNFGGSNHVELQTPTYVTIGTDALIAFSDAVGGVIQTSSSVVFSVASGNTVGAIQVSKGTTSHIMILEDVINETFTANGTYTINLVSVTLTDGV